MEKIKFPRVGEEMYHEKLENGLNVFVFPKPDHCKSYAFFATNYGGMDMRFKLGGQWHDTPAGVAHFLEHKMFDTQDGNALQDLAAQGGNGHEPPYAAQPADDDAGYEGAGNLAGGGQRKHEPCLLGAHTPLVQQRDQPHHQQP